MVDGGRLWNGLWERHGAVHGDKPAAGGILSAGPHLLFGSEGRGHSCPESDLDFPIVAPDGAPKGCLRGGAASSILGDLREADFDGRASYVRASLPATVVREGKLLYAARGVLA